MRSPRPVSTALLAVLLGGAAAVNAQLPRSARTVILTPDSTDSRVAAAREAIEFWNRSFSELGLEPRLASPDVVVGSPVTRTLENYSRRIWTRAGRVRGGPHQPYPPPALVELPADVVVFLSAQNLMPFSWPMGSEGRYFIAVNLPPEASHQQPVDARNVIAHEIGHAFGLVHQNDPGALMCLPCESLPAGDSPFLELTPLDRDRLRELYSVAPPTPDR